jgi:LacI family gluconate utilization system Gnt-I transcriptional repressor
LILERIAHHGGERTPTVIDTRFTLLHRQSS